MTLPLPSAAAPAPGLVWPNDPTVLTAPWSEDQVANLNRHQRAGVFHPFTCGRRDEHRDNPGVLVATVDGWRCPAAGCEYVQAWAHRFMAMTPSPALIARERFVERMRRMAALPRPCLLHEDIHPDHGPACMRAYAEYLMNHHLGGRAARDAYVLEVEQRILNRLVRQHAPATTRRLNPALSK
ncbi:hypothetical protein AB0958_19130 [Streptomyces sp. NPDC006655]|uniref:hypothetical protein n=1 Tax=Streptomyces sp. NPDC006655 TaxID=3156898 RepID=UPI003453EFCD